VTARNFQVFEPLAFIAEVTQHVPEAGQHLKGCWLKVEG